MTEPETVEHAIARAERVLPGRPAPDGQRDPRWQAIIAVGDFIESDPDAVWAFARRWGRHAQQDLRMAVATCLLEHLLEHHFTRLWPAVKDEARASVRFADTLSMCAIDGEAARPENLRRIRRLDRELGTRPRGYPRWPGSPRASV